MSLYINTSVLIKGIIYFVKVITIIYLVVRFFFIYLSVSYPFLFMITENLFTFLQVKIVLFSLRLILRTFIVKNTFYQRFYSFVTISKTKDNDVLFNGVSIVEFCYL